MFLSKEKLLSEANKTKYRAEIIEKVAVLIWVLNAIAKDDYLNKRLALKGGTALNLFYFNLPRLSVDIDLNYVGSVVREIMIAEKPQVEARLIAILQQFGLSIHRQPTVHAGGKMVWRYPSNLGGQGTLEIDLNYMFRVPLWPVVYKPSIMLAGQKAYDVPVLDIHELAAGKLSALIDRRAGRDIFDAYYLLTQYPLDHQLLRFALVVYLGIGGNKNIATLMPEDIQLNWLDFKNKLIPVLKIDSQKNQKVVKEWADQLIQTIQQKLNKFLPFTANEKQFFRKLFEEDSIQLELICGDELQIERIRHHPGLKWTLLRNNKRN